MGDFSDDKGDNVVLLVDLGGTNARFQLRNIAGAGANGVQSSMTDDVLLAEKIYPTQQAPTFTSLVSRFLNEEIPDFKGRILACSAAVCGPVFEAADRSLNAVCLGETINEGKGWRFSSTEVSEVLSGCPVTLMNDFVAVGTALPYIPKEDLRLIHKTAEVQTVEEALKSTAVTACLGPGTGLGNVYSVYIPEIGRRKVLPSEGCMTEFVPKDQTEWEFNEWMKQKSPSKYYNPIDSAVSGLGIAEWYHFLYSRLEAPSAADREIHTAVSAAAQKAKIIAENAADNALCSQALDHFLSTLGSEAGNLSMRFLAKGGCYIAGGGIAAKLFDKIIAPDGPLLSAYRNRGQATEIVEMCPLLAAATPNMGMIGARAVAVLMIANRSQ